MGGRGRRPIRAAWQVSFCRGLHGIASECADDMKKDFRGHVRPEPLRSARGGREVPGSDRSSAGVVGRGGKRSISLPGEGAGDFAPPEALRVAAPVQEGSVVTAGTINYEGPVDVRATATGSESVLAGIGKMVVEAQSREAPVARLADGIAGRCAGPPLTLSLSPPLNSFLPPPVPGRGDVNILPPPGRFCYSVMSISLATGLFWGLAGAEMFPQVQSPRPPRRPARPSPLCLP